MVDDASVHDKLVSVLRSYTCVSYPGFGWLYGMGVPRPAAEAFVVTPHELRYTSSEEAI